MKALGSPVRTFLLALAVAVAIAPAALAQHHGGGHGGGSHPSGGAHGGGGWGGRPGGGWHGGYGGYGGGWHGGYGRGYGYAGWGWGRPGWGWWGWGGGWGWGGAGWGWGAGWYGPWAPAYYGGWAPGYYGGAYYTPYGYGYGYVPGNWTIVDTSVSPETTRVFLDGQFIGMVEDFDGPEYLYLKKGDYQLEFRLDGFETKTVALQARSGAQIKINDQLKKIPGAKQYGSYDNPEPAGGVQRFWTREDNVAQPTSPMSGEASRGWRGQPQSAEPSDEPGASVEARPDSRPAPPEAEAPPAAGTERPTAKSRSHLVFRITPSDAAVYLDDHFAGSAEELSTLTRGLLVLPGQHTVTVSRPGLRTREETVLVGPGKSEVVDISLEGP